MKQYGSIDFKKQQDSGLSIIEWLLLEQIHFTSASKQSRSMNGWVMVNAKEYAEFLGVSDRTIRNHIRLLLDSGWIDQDEVTKMLRCSDKYIEINTVASIKKDVKNDKNNGETTSENISTDGKSFQNIFLTSENISNTVENFSKNMENISDHIHYEYEEIEGDRVNKEPLKNIPAKSSKSNLLIPNIEHLLINPQTIQKFIESRQLAKKPMSQHAIDLLIKKLEGFQSQGYDIEAVVTDAIINGYQGVFANGNHKKKLVGSGSFSPKVANSLDVVDRFMKRHGGV